jgi:hypothetical protein
MSLSCIDCGKFTKVKNICLSCSVRKAKTLSLEASIKKFWEKVDKNGPIMVHMTTPCWIWLGCKSKKGYGQLTFQGKNWWAYKFSYWIYYGEIPSTNIICHHCDNPACVNPEHLYLGTYKSNMIDREQRGRVNRVKGQQHKNAKLTELEVIEILTIWEQSFKKRGLVPKLALKYNVSRATVSNIVKHKGWKHVSLQTN